MINIENLTKTYGKGKTKAVDNISIEVKSGEIFGFLGPNGAGKTTTIKMIVGLLKPDEGRVLIDGIDMWEDSLEAKKLISYVPDQPVMYDKLTGLEYLNFIADMYEVSEEDRKNNIDRYSKLFSIDGALGNLVESYSHGMRQKLLLTAALVHDPKIFILDEPMVGLDPKSAFNIKETMKSLCAEGKTVFFSTHVLEVAENLCDRIGIIAHGKIIKIGTMEDLKSEVEDRKTLENIFLELTENE